MYGLGDFVGGCAARREKTYPVIAFAQISGLAVAVPALFLLGRGWPGWQPIVFGALGGIGGAFGLFALYRGLGRTVVSVVSPTSALVSAVIPIAFGFVTGERPGTAAIAGMAICVPAILLLSFPEAGAADGRRGKVRQALLYGAAAGVGFGFFFIMMSRANRDSGLWPLVAGRLTSVSVILASAALTQRSIVARGRASWALIALAGVFDIGANIAFLIASRMGLLSVVSAITSLYPMPTVFLAWLILKERLGRAHAIGIGLAILGGALIGCG